MSTDAPSPPDPCSSRDADLSLDVVLMSPSERAAAAHALDYIARLFGYRDRRDGSVTTIYAARDD